jgi:hypothetical protein
MSLSEAALKQAIMVNANLALDLSKVDYMEIAYDLRCVEDGLSRRYALLVCKDHESGGWRLLLKGEEVEANASWLMALRGLVEVTAERVGERHSDITETTKHEGDVEAKGREVW